jgi:hypothetical protein
MPCQKRGLCVTCGRVTSTRFHNVPDKAKAYIKEHLLVKTKETRATPKVCHKCFYDLEEAKPSVMKSTISRAGNGLFADRDYGFNEFVCWYSGVLLLVVRRFC